ncbi:hypothetical protein JNUCC23_23230 (plasmid) [Peribacillus sp. JNUCC 23]
MFKELKIDTIYVVTKVTNRQFDALKEFITFRYNSPYYEALSTQSLNNDNVDYALKYNVKDELGRPNVTRFMRDGYNLKLEMQSNCLKDMPDKIKQLLQQFDWKIQQIELAYDFNDPISNHFSFIEANTDIRYKHKNKDAKEDYGQNYYIYADSSPQQALIYDKKKQLREQKGIEIDDRYLLRYEITIKPKLNEQKPIHELQFDWVNQYLDKFTFVPNMRDVNKSLFDSLVLKIMRRRTKHMRKEPKKLRQKVRGLAEQNKFDFISIFDDNAEQLFNWLPKKITLQAQ